MECFVKRDYHSTLVLEHVYRLFTILFSVLATYLGVSSAVIPSDSPWDVEEENLCIRNIIFICWENWSARNRDREQTVAAEYQILHPKWGAEDRQNAKHWVL